MDLSTEFEQELAFEDVQRLLEAVHVWCEPATRLKCDRGELGVNRALVGPDQTVAGEATRVRADQLLVRERPIQLADVVPHRPTRRADPARPASDVRARTRCRGPVPCPGCRADAGRSNRWRSSRPVRAHAPR